MTPLFPSQRAAEEFERVLSGTADDALAAHYAELLDAVEQLRTFPEVTPRAEFVGDLRTRLMTAAETELVPSPRATTRAVPSIPQERARRKRRLGTIAASLVVVGGTAGMAAASAGALPGDPLYPIKRGIEQVTTAAHLGDANQGKALLGQAATRLDEVRALQAQGNADPDVIAQTMDAFRSEADAGSKKLFTSYESSSNQADITSVRDFTAAQMADVTAMSTVADTVTNDLLRDAADTLADIDAQARGLCAACAPSDRLAPPSALSSGAGAATFANLFARPISQVHSDIAAADAAHAQQVKDLKDLKQGAQDQANTLPTLPTGTSQGGTGGYVFPGTPGDGSDNPLSSAITPDGKLLPTVTSGAAVTDLVTGVTSTTNTVTNGATDPVTKPLGDAVKKAGDALGDTVGKTTDNVLP